ncbi:flagellar basal body P-ring protein FlgI [Ralstonia pseudosolanacearum]|uniref:flagellar basal body P-ring protein FlgI n=2 Tax=Ralstonia pseudosolanacearum TaxID=1310165 RepID=UPI00049101C2|nr:flagellar basal body P-ring protein FlgI [Ralstonia pseudosolanacearum]MDO3557850.1 flagellar basal body P-ring protein FlgI [Ralstonia pseudosolanacearum]MDO3576966.1 flagellar basal body P-ring protein FlgI [Ralstonia pseudosolanacearum]MDO3586512.1 flagellar basal body P-ring protein FlgI [Ralstonia pseudosolanacearum]
MKTLHRCIGVALLALGALAGTAHADRIKDLTTIAGVRENALIGYGLVVGLDGSGDQTTQTPFTIQSFNNMLSQFGINVPSGSSIQLKNTAAVVVTASLPAFVRPGQTIDVTVSSIGNAKSLRGGTLLLTPLKGVDGQLYALAQGNVVIGGAGASANGSKVQINQLGAGRIANGATVERTVPATVGEAGSIQLDTGTTDFGTVQNIVNAINKQFGADTAEAADGRTVNVRAPAPALAADRVGFVAKLQNIEVTPAQAAARVVVNARTGSVVMNQQVKLEPCAVAHGNLSVTISTEPVVSQPAPFSQGQTVAGARSNIEVKQQGGSLINVKGGTNLADVVKAINAIGANPQDLISILQAMKAANALRADLEII